MTRTIDDLRELYEKSNKGGPDRDYSVQVMRDTNSQFLINCSVPSDSFGGPHTQGELYVVPTIVEEYFLYCPNALFDDQSGMHDNIREAIDGPENNPELTALLERWGQYDALFQPTGHGSENRRRMQLRFGKNTLKDDFDAIRIGTKLEVGLDKITSHELGGLLKTHEEQGWFSLANVLTHTEIQFVRRDISRF